MRALMCANEHGLLRIVRVYRLLLARLADRDLQA